MPMTLGKSVGNSILITVMLGNDEAVAQHLDYLICDIVAPRRRVLLIFYSRNFPSTQNTVRTGKPGIVANGIPDDEIATSVYYRRLFAVT